MDGPRIDGDRVLLRPVEPADRDARAALGWWTAIERGYGHVKVDRDATADDADRWYAGARRLAEDPAAVSWVVEADGGLAGAAFLHRVDLQDQRAWYAVGMLHPRFLGRGLGTEATALVLDHAFGPLGLHRVDLRVLAFNTAAVRCYEACGFVLEGRERETCRIGGERHDDLVMGVLATDPRPGARAAPESPDSPKSPREP